MAKIYVLGAGASKGIHRGMPDMMVLNKKVRDLVWQSNQAVFVRLQSFIRTMFPHWRKGRNFTLEELLTLLDSVANQNRPFAGFSLDHLKQLQADFLFGINEAISQLIVASNISVVESFEQYMGLVLPFLNSLENTDAIISLNYDTLIDGRIGDGLFHNDIFTRINHQGSVSDRANYGFDPRYALVDKKKPSQYRSFPFVPIYKLHGSFNWLYCRQCKQIDVTLINPKNQRLLPYDASSGSLGTCPDCKSAFEPVIITPSLIKEYKNPYLKRIWAKAKRALARADEIIFVGYSMPDADMILRTMFIESIVTNRSKRAVVPTISVVDYSQSDNGKVKRQYERWFGDINYHKDGFSEYIKQHCPATP